MIDDVRALIWKPGIVVKEYIFLVVESEQIVPSKRRPKGHRLIEFPGGTNADHPEESPWKTLEREVEEETGLTYRADAPEKFLEELENSTIRHGFLIPFSKCDGLLRVGKNVTDRHKRLYPPQWMRLDELCEPLAQTQRGVLFKALCHLGMFRDT